MAACGDDSENEMAIRELTESCGRADDIYPMVSVINASAAVTLLEQRPKKKFRL